MKDASQDIIELGDMLVYLLQDFTCPPVYGKQILYFLDKTFSEHSKIDAPEKKRCYR